tara:strand:+ start:136 stop:567 length:432 start_codon:yes stop_codon:yes gene_type:complete
MAFKLGKTSNIIASSGELRKKHRFGREAGDQEVSIPGNPVIRKKLEEGVLGEANMDGTIFVSEDVEPGSAQERHIINHEMRHATDMKIGKLAYGDDFVKYNGVTYPRTTINGKDMIIVDGVAKEAGDGGFPWEVEANNGNHYY